ncbi:hypothetical protein HDU96_009863, partial [Phlyctochytrium bullatum]
MSSGRRGRPPGTKNQPGSKRPGPKPKASIASTSSSGPPRPSPTTAEDGSIGRKRQKTNEAPPPTFGHGSSKPSKGKETIAAAPLAPLFLRNSAAPRNAAIDSGSSGKGIQVETVVVDDTERVEVITSRSDDDSESLDAPDERLNEVELEFDYEINDESESFTILPVEPLSAENVRISEHPSFCEAEAIVLSDDDEEEEEEEGEEHNEARSSSHRGGAMSKNKIIEGYLVDLENQIKTHGKDGSKPQCYSPIAFPEFTESYGGYVPSARFFRDVFTTLVEEQAAIMKKHQQMLPMRVCRIDMSHKLPKRLATLNGVKMHEGVLSIMNEYDEITLMALVPSKSQDHWRPLLEDIRKSLAEFGLDQPQVFYTDNPDGYSNLLLNIFPSLSENLTSPQMHSPENSAAGGEAGLDLPATAIVTQNEQNIREVLLDIFELVAAKGEIAVTGLETLPDEFITFFEDERIKKVGRNVSGDIKRIIRDKLTQRGVDSITVRGIIELGGFCKRRGLITYGGLSLQSIFCIVCQKSFPKDRETTLSNWSVARLTQKQINYVIWDTYAGFLIYTEASKYDFFDPKGLKPGDRVTFFTEDMKSVAGHGELRSIFPGRASKREALVVVNGTGISDLDLRCVNSPTVETPGEELDQSALSADFGSNFGNYGEDGSPEEEEDDDGEDIVDPLFNSVETLAEVDLSRFEASSRGLREAAALGALAHLGIEATVCRVLCDPWHAMKSLTISKKHSLYKEFCCRMRKKDGLAVYRSLRGTSQLEGGLHTQISRRYGAVGMSPILSTYIMMEFQSRHAAEVGGKNPKRKHIQKHFDFILLEELHSHYMDMGLSMPPSLVDFTNTRYYSCSSGLNRIGIPEIPTSVRLESNMEVFNSPPVSIVQMKSLDFMAKQQSTRFAVVPISTPAEYRIFRTLVRKQREDKAALDFNGLARTWNEEKANGVNVFYKLPDHLRVHYKAYIRTQMVTLSLAASGPQHREFVADISEDVMQGVNALDT